jgi:hypothetical protein
MLIDTPCLKRWWLPDGRHQYNSVLHGDAFYISIIDSRTHETVKRHTVRIDKEGKWKDLLLLSQELANKKYKKELRYERKR